MYELLSRPLKVGGITLKNRMLSAPTSMAVLNEQEHYNAKNIAYYKLKAQGGCALVTVGDVIVDRVTGRSHPMQAGLDDPELVPYLVDMADAIHSGGAMASVEIDHGGALCDPAFLGGKNAIGPSGCVDAWGDTIEEMTEEQIYAVADAFGRGAATLKRCGFDMVMLHAGHGWLIHQFLSPISNRRTDKWGGSLENRLRFLLLVVEKIRAAVGRSFPIDVRMSGTEYIDGGYGLETGVEIAKALDGKVDLLHVSAGSMYDDHSAVMMHPGVFQKPGQNGYLAAEIKKHVKTPVCSVGAWSDPELMEAFLAETGVDCLAMGRALIADPFLPKKVLLEKPALIHPCIRCGECQSGMMATGSMRCTINPVIGREEEFFHPVPVLHKRRVLIAGGGPGGMQAALEAQARGHEVTLCEAGPRLGGMLKFADWGEMKMLIRRYRDHQIARVTALPIDLRLNTPVTKELVEELKPDVLIAALGSRPVAPPIPGRDGPNVVFGADLTSAESVGETVVVIGGGLVGCETGLHLAREGRKVTLLEMLPELAADCGRMHRLGLLYELEHDENVTILTNTSCERIEPAGVTAGGRFLPCDTVVMAAGLASQREAVDALRPLVREFYNIGDGNRPGRIMHAVRNAYDAAANLGL